MGGLQGHIYKNKQEGQDINSHTAWSSIRLVCVCPDYLPHHHTVQSTASEEPVNLLSLRVQVDVVETRPGGQAGNRGHLRKTVREYRF